MCVFIDNIENKVVKPASNLFGNIENQKKNWGRKRKTTGKAHRK